jgi:hypothetical protein
MSDRTPLETAALALLPILVDSQDEMPVTPRSHDRDYLARLSVLMGNLVELAEDWSSHLRKWDGKPATLAALDTALAEIRRIDAG